VLEHLVRLLLGGDNRIGRHLVQPDSVMDRQPDLGGVDPHGGS